MITSMVKLILTGVMIFLTYRWCIHELDKPAGVIDGQRVLRTTMGYRACSVLIAGIALLVVYAALYARAGQQVLATLVAIAFIVGAVYLVYQAFFIHIAYDKNRIACRQPLRRTTQIMWQDVVNIHCVSNRCTVIATSGRCIGFHTYRQGMKQFEKFLTTRFNL